MFNHLFIDLLSVAVLIRELRRSGRPRGPGQQAFPAWRLANRVGSGKSTVGRPKTSPSWLKLAPSRPKLALLGASGAASGLLGRSWPLWGCSWGGPGRLLVRSWRLLGRSWTAPDLCWLALGTSWTSFGPSWPALGSQELIFTKTSIGPVFCGSDLASGAPKLARSWAKLAYVSVSWLEVGSKSLLAAKMSAWTASNSIWTAKKSYTSRPRPSATRANQVAAGRKFVLKLKNESLPPNARRWQTSLFCLSPVIRRLHHAAALCTQAIATTTWTNTRTLSDKQGGPHSSFGE